MPTGPSLFAGVTFDRACGRVALKPQDGRAWKRLCRRISQLCPDGHEVVALLKFSTNLCNLRGPARGRSFSRLSPRPPLPHRWMRGALLDASESAVIACR